MNCIYAKLKDSNEIYELKLLEDNKILLKKGNITINTTEDKIERVNRNLKDKEKIVTKIKLKKFDLKNEIMLRHMSKDEALSVLDKFLDTMVVNNISMVKIIHGKNNGILRNAVHKYLTNNPNVKSFRLGNYYEGSLGVTIVFMK